MKTRTAVLALLSLMIVGIVAAGALAYRGDPDVTGPNYNEEAHDLIEAAIESGDYDEWIALREEYGLPMNGRIFDVIDENNFYLFSEMHEAMEEGDLDRAQEIRTELGLGLGQMNRGEGQGKGMHQGMHGGQGRNQNSAGSFVDADGDRNCDNLGMNQGRGRR